MVVVLGVAALVIDRAVLDSGVTEPSPAAAAEPAPDPARAAAIGADSMEHAAGVLSVGQRLETVREAQERVEISDAFAAVGGWFGKPGERDRDKSQVPGGYRLTSLSPGLGLATINGRVMGLDGREINGIRLHSIDAATRTAVIETGGEMIELRLAQPENELPRRGGAPADR